MTDQPINYHEAYAKHLAEARRTNFELCGCDWCVAYRAHPAPESATCKEHLQVQQREISVVEAELIPQIRDIIYAIGMQGATSAERAKAICDLFRPYLRTMDLDKCPDCGADMVEVCSGLENTCRGDAASTCRHSDYCEKPIKPVSVDLEDMTQIANIAFEKVQPKNMDYSVDAIEAATKAILEAIGVQHD